jgi:hypothetical protein
LSRRAIHGQAGARRGARHCSRHARCDPLPQVLARTIDKNPALFDQWVGGSYKLLPDEWGNIKVDFTLLGKVPRLQIAGTLIHESTHKMKNAVDHCYASSSGTYKTLTKAQAMDNADSYAFVAISLYKMTYIKNDKKLKELGSSSTVDVES